MKTIGILGCGWLGFPLAKKLIAEGYNVNGSTTSAEKITDLAEEKINPFLIKLTEEKVEGKIEEFLENVAILIIDIPPGLRKNPEENFEQKIKNLFPYLERSSLEKMFFVSSTSVFQDEFPFPAYTEKSKPNGTTENAKQLIATENLFQKSAVFSSTIIRFGGLIGENRHPVHFLAGRTSLKNPKAPINLIHQKDCISLIFQLIQQQNLPKIVHGVFPFHPSKKEYYQQKATEYKLEIPQFLNDSSSKGKIISSEKTRELLKFNFSIQP
ncbi:NAD(P)-binding domain-containing protein [Mesonia maritima]|uniref:Nucleoside-diphosphate-sugar epimerase n=1 Tax=Mesonia maritima TaxID=1793873 RepID=A0ABU1K2H5_9FLAO|nr:NAD(P)-binding domain-containing protein [Mesonia maritima]MDR6299511.1 nucleoside-diphosphate-sugar epimerase [Mesonia maritima]